MGYFAEQQRWRLSVEYDYLHQDQLRSGTRQSRQRRTGTELERETLNRYITAGLSYSPHARLEPRACWRLTSCAPIPPTESSSRSAAAAA